ncbi:MAG: Ribonuclease [Anaerosolibacter sp.]|jgi:ribonuclease HI|uniref:ribonuclease H family protein n=1 Tax=Anaerosolibacter sp. TaxID=1872527 RepID=UPI00260C1C03|nr:ribonuclease H family protein [Anaerosolibacter sp.]MDF2546105.1 Ribonuclease [Anaerosolibacter sp.]
MAEKSKKFYAIRQGRKTGIFLSWAECEKQIRGYSGAEYKGFADRRAAEAYLGIAVSAAEEKEIHQLNDDEMIAYVDGSYDDSKKAYGSGVVIWYHGEKTVFSEKGEEKDLLDMRNVAGEIKGAVIAMNHAVKSKAKILYLYYDYEGIEKWCTGTWQAKKLGTKRYKEFYDKISQKLDVKFIKVEAHTGVEYNEEADILAKQAILGKVDNVIKEEKVLIEKNINFEKTIVKNGKFKPVLNILIGENVLSIEEINKKFKQELKKKKKTLKEIKSFDLILDVLNCELCWHVETETENYKITIKE